MSSESDGSVEVSIEERIAGLTPQQATRATRSFYDYLPGDFWEGGRKPPMARIETLSKQVRQGAPQDVQPFVHSLLDEDESPAKGELCKLLLRQFASDESLRPVVERAVSLAEQPVMAFDPVSIGAILLVLTALSTKVSYSSKKSTEEGKTAQEKQITVENRAPELITSLAEAIKALPKSMLEAFAK